MWYCSYQISDFVSRPICTTMYYRIVLLVWTSHVLYITTIRRNQFSSGNLVSEFDAGSFRPIWWPWIILQKKTCNNKTWGRREIGPQAVAIYRTWIVVKFDVFSVLKHVALLHVFNKQKPENTILMKFYTFEQLWVLTCVFHKEYGHTPKIQFGLIFMFFTVLKHFALLHVVF